MRQMTETAMRKADGGAWTVKWVADGRLHSESWSNKKSAVSQLKQKRKLYGDWAANLYDGRGYVVDI